MYTVAPREQALIFLASLGVGFILGVVYDLLRALRLSITKSKPAIIVFDLLYFFIVAFASFVFILAANKGEVRSYIIIGELIGAVAYYFSFGITVIKITDRFVRLLRRVYAFVFKAVTLPFRLLKRLFTRLFSKIKLIFKKSEKKSQKIIKKHLQKAHRYVYNLFGILCVRSKLSQKGGKANEASKKEHSA